MKTKWIRDYYGEACCAVCGMKKSAARRDPSGTLQCCPVTEDPVSREEFKDLYFGDDPTVTPGIVSEFYEDYCIGNYASVDDYIKDTVEELE